MSQDTTIILGFYKVFPLPIIWTWVCFVASAFEWWVYDNDFMFIFFYLSLYWRTHTQKRYLLQQIHGSLYTARAYVVTTVINNETKPFVDLFPIYLHIYLIQGYIYQLLQWVFIIPECIYGIFAARYVHMQSHTLLGTQIDTDDIDGRYRYNIDYRK